ncbi:MAG: alpha/beta fold hydrolase [Desulfobacterales bacterium]|nr:alpha/beta fold hydrolase [Desulfobacterales bacterium]
MIIIYILLILYLIALIATINLYFVAWYDYVNFRAAQPDSGEWRQSIHTGRMLLYVFLESLALFFHVITQPLRYLFDRMPPKKVSDPRPPILLVHGWSSGSHAFMLISWYLKRKKFKNIYTMTYRPVMADLEGLSQKVADRINEVLKKTGAEKVNIVAHSLGGVLARYAIKNLYMEDKVSRLISIGSPHRGSRVAALWPYGRNTLQLLYESDFIKALEEGGLTPGRVKYVSIYSAFDNFIIPQESANLGDSAVNHKLSYHGHLRLLYSHKVNRLVREALEGGLDAGDASAKH